VILKNLSRTNADGSGKLVSYIFRYIFRDHERTDTQREMNIVFDKQELYRKFKLPKGVHLTKLDLMYLHGEYIDAKLMAHMKEKGYDKNPVPYIQKYLLADRGKAQGKEELMAESAPKPFIIRHNMRSRSLEGFKREFEQNEKGRMHKRKDATSIHHTIISFSNLDKAHVTEKMLRDISREYIRLRGENNLYCGTVHNDRDHIHLHIAMSGTEMGTGKSSRISKKKFEDVKIALQSFQRLHYPELKHSLPEHGRAKSREKTKEEIQKIKTDERATYRSELMGIATISAKSKSTEHFISQLNDKGYSIYSRNGNEPSGIVYKGYKFRFNKIGVDLEPLRQQDIQREKDEQILKELHDLRNKEWRELGIKESISDIEKETGEKMIVTSEGKSLQDLRNLKDLRELEQLRGSHRDGPERDFSLYDPDMDEPEDMSENEQEDEDARDMEELEMEDEALDIEYEDADMREE